MCGSFVYAFFEVLDSNRESTIDEALGDKRAELTASGSSENDIQEELAGLEEKFEFIFPPHESSYENVVRVPLIAVTFSLILAVFISAFFMRKVFRKTQLGVIFLASLTPAIWQTYLFSDTRGLIILSSIESKNHSFNRYTRDGGFISPAMANWIFINLQGFYDECLSLNQRLNMCDMPLVNSVGTTLDSGSDETIERQYQILMELVARGVSLNEAHHGLSPIHESILFNNPRYAEILINSGADIQQVINKLDKDYNGYNALEYLNYLEQTRSRDMSKIRALINEKLDSNVNSDD